LVTPEDLDDIEHLLQEAVDGREPTAKRIDRQDAERYRWLRMYRPTAILQDILRDGGYFPSGVRERLDAVIDEKRSAK
jgi:hypothetical protein